MNEGVTPTAHGPARSAPRLEAVLLAHTDVLAARRRVLALAPGPELFEVLESLAQLDRRYAVRSAHVDPSHATASYDVVLADVRRFGVSESRSVKELARLLCPGGRAIVAVAPERAATVRRRLAAEGFLVALAAADESTQVLVGVRGEFAASEAAG